jgi:hypothetical protein
LPVVQKTENSLPFVVIDFSVAPILLGYVLGPVLEQYLRIAAVERRFRRIRADANKRDFHRRIGAAARGATRALAASQYAPPGMFGRSASDNVTNDVAYPLV